MKTNQIFGLMIVAIIFFSSTEINAQKKSNSLHRKAQARTISEGNLAGLACNQNHFNKPPELCIRRLKR